MSSALKPALPPGGAQASPGKPVPASPSKPAPAGVAPPLVGQNLVHHPASPAHAAHNAAHVPMSPVSHNMVQMAHNMSHHGNLSHVGHNNGAAPAGASNGAPQKSEPPPGAPLSLVQDKCPSGAPRPLALTRTGPPGPADKKDEQVAPGRANGVAEPSPAAAEPARAEPGDTPAEAAPAPDSTGDPQLQVDKLGSSTDSAEPSRPAEPQQGDAAAAPAPSGQKTPDETVEARTTASPVHPTPPAESKPADVGSSEQVEAKVPSETPSGIKTETKPPGAIPAPTPVTAEPSPKKEEAKKEETERASEASSSPATKKSDSKAPTTKSTLKLATVAPPLRKRRPEPAGTDPAASSSVSPASHSTPESRASKRNRTKVQPYQSPTAELALVTKLSVSAAAPSARVKPTDDKLIVFYKNEYLAVRNAEGGFYVCQAMQNVYRTSRKIKIRWLSQDKTLDPKGHTYKPDFYDTTDMECVLTTLSMTRAPAGGGAQVLSETEAGRARSILERALSAETGAALHLTEEHPDGLDLSLYKDESQLEKRKKASRKRKSEADKSEGEADKEEEVKSKSARKSGKRGSGAGDAAAAGEKGDKQSGGISGANKVGIVRRIYKHTALSEAATPVKSASKRNKSTPASAPTKTRTSATPAPAPATPASHKPSPRTTSKDAKLEQLAATPSTSTGKTRTSRHPPHK